MKNRIFLIKKIEWNGNESIFFLFNFILAISFHSILKYNVGCCIHNTENFKLNQICWKICFFSLSLTHSILFSLFLPFQINLRCRNFVFLLLFSVCDQGIRRHSFCCFNQIIFWSTNNVCFVYVVCIMNKSYFFSIVSWL